MSSANYKPNSFYSFCTDIQPEVAPGVNYTFAPKTFAASSPPAPGVAPAWYNDGSGPNGYLPAIEKAETLYVKDLFNSVNTALSASVRSVNAAALQLAIWNVLYDSDYSVSSGAGLFYVTQTSAAIINQANAYLSDLVNGYSAYDSTWLDPRGLNTPATQGLLYAPENALRLTVPDGGMTVAMLGFSLSGLGLLARKLRK
jgi:hypothetical protein